MAIKSLSSLRTEIFGSLLTDLYNKQGEPSWIYDSSSYHVNTPSSKIKAARIAAPKPPGGSSSSGHHGITDFLGNVVSNVEQVAVGIPRGLYETVRHPIGTAENIAKSYGERYSPLIHGDFGEFMQQVYDHPVDFALDAATLAATVGSLGTLAPVAVGVRGLALEGDVGAAVGEAGAAAAKAGVFAGATRAARAAAIESKFGGMASHRLIRDSEGRITHVLESSGHKYSPKGMTGSAVLRSEKATSAVSRFSKLGGGTPGAARELTTRAGNKVDVGTWSSNPVIRVRQRMVALAAGKLIRDTGPLSYFSESNRAIRFQARMARNGAEAAAARSAEWNAISRKLSKEEHQAIKIRSLGYAEGVMTPDILLDHISKLEEQGKHIESGFKETLMNPRVRALVANPSARMTRGIAALEDLHTENARLLADRKILPAAAAMERPYRFLQVVRGAKEVSHIQAQKVVQVLDKRLQNGKQRYATAIKEREREIGNLMHRGHQYPGERALALERVAKLEAEIHQIHNIELPNLADAIAEHKRVIKRSFVGEGDAALQKIKDAIDAAGGEHPFYYPDMARISGKDMRLPDPRGGGLGVPRGESLNRGALMEVGKVIVDGTAVTAKAIQSSKKVLYSDLHQILLDEATHVGINQRLPQGWKYLRADIRDKVPPIARANEGEKTFHNAGFTAEDEAYVNDWTTTDPRDPRVSGDGSNLLAIDPQTLKAVVGEYKAGAVFLNKILRMPTQMWRALILGWSPRFFVNNFVGNHMLYAIRVNPLAGLKALTTTWHNEFASEKKARKFMGHARTPKNIQNLVVAELFPGQLQGGFVGMQRDIERGLRGSLMHGPFAPAVQFSAEKLPRYALVRSLLEQTPEFKTMERVMGDANFEDIAVEMKRTGTISQHRLDQISRQVDDALGNYKDLTRFERNVVRTLVPFYSWYRAIMRITFALPEKHPMKAVLMARVGEVGSDINATRYGKDMPEFLRGILPIGFTPPGMSAKDMERHTIMTTQGINPFETVAQMAQAGSDLAALATGGKADFSGNDAVAMTNPFLQAGIELTSQKDILSGQDVNVGVGQALISPFVNSPQVQMEQAFTGNTKKPTAHSLYTRDPAQYVWSFVGVPFKQLYVPTAHAMYHLDKNPPKYIKIRKK